PRARERKRLRVVCSLLRSQSLREIGGSNWRIDARKRDCRETPGADCRSTGDPGAQSDGALTFAFSMINRYACAGGNGNRFVVRADEKLMAFMELESAIHQRVSLTR